MAQGHRDILHAAGPSTNYDAADRRVAFEAAIARFPDVCGRVVEVDYTEEQVIATAREMILNVSTPPDALVAWNDTTALLFLDIIQKRDARSSSRPIAVTGWDNSPYIDMLGLTSVRMPMSAMGDWAAMRMYERLEKSDELLEPVRYKLPLELVVRGSSSVLG